MDVLPTTSVADITGAFESVVTPAAMGIVLAVVGLFFGLKFLLRRVNKGLKGKV